MPRTNADTDIHIGRRIKLRDLQILLAVAQCGSMAKAASQLSTTQPAVSQAIAELEDAVGVRLFDRSTQGVVPTQYGTTLLQSAVAAFDALKQGLRSIEFSAASGAGDVWIGCAEIAMYGLLPAVIQRLAEHHPKIAVHATITNPSDDHYQHLRDRRVDLIIGRFAQSHVDEDLLVETLFEDVFAVVVSAQSPWASRSKIELAELMNESWIFGEPGNSTQARISEVFRARVGGLPRIALHTTWMSLRLELLASGNYISCIPTSTYRYGTQRHPLKALPIDMGLKLPVALFTLKNRTLSPAVAIFIETAREVAKTMSDGA